ncbi:MAG TPA: class I SAM-dependent methyltransferase [Rhizomicrobium sp.]|jgi:SAM-dependent methyltransferase|nr:class I SAM-dependent methyltransferase [Rhizomicrobium sp.]
MAETDKTPLLPGARAFNKDLAPAFIDHACIVNGYAPPPGSPLGEGMDAGFSYCELDCGSAVTETLLAASNPLGDFHAIDARLPMIEQGRTLAKDGGARNITFHHAGLEAALEKTLPAFDYIVINNVYSWIPLRDRGLILSFVRKFLKPGGAVYVSYNARPGWNKLDPFRRVFREATRGLRAEPIQRLNAARDIYARLLEAKAAGIAATGLSAQAFEALGDIPLDALAADYVNEYAEPLYVTEAMADFAAVDCVLTGSSMMAESLPVLMGHEPFKSILEKLPTLSGRELAKDMLLDTRYRRDVFVRGGKRLAGDNRDMVMNGLAFALEQPAADVRFTARVPFGEMRFDNPHVHTLVAMLENGPRTLGELIAEAQAQNADAQAVVANVHALLLTNQIRPVYRGTPEAASGARAMADAVRARATSAEQAIGFLPSPFGTAFLTPVADQLFMQIGPMEGADALADAALARLSEGNVPFVTKDAVTKRARAWKRNVRYFGSVGVLPGARG